MSVLVWELIDSGRGREYYFFQSSAIGVFQSASVLLIHTSQGTSESRGEFQVFGKKKSL